MTVRWTKPSADDLAHIYDYTEERFGAAQARRAALAIYASASSLKDTPQRGRKGRKPGTREIPVSGLPLVIIYRVGKEAMEIAASCTERSNGHKAGGGFPASLPSSPCLCAHHPRIPATSGSKVVSQWHNRQMCLQRWALLLGLAITAGAQTKTELLYPNGAPGAVGSEEVDKPTLAYYPPPSGKGNGAAVIVCPGGGYAGLAMDHEGKQIAEWLNARGLAAFVLKYRLGPRYHHPAMLNDAQRAIRMVRSQAADLGVAPGRIGIWGFSAGGHLASTAATHFDNGNAASTDPIERAGSRPDFAILSYPVISFTTPYTHKGSKRNLLGDNPDPKLVTLLSNELQVTASTPPTFLFHTTTDTSVPPENSVLFYLALRKAGVPAEMHIYELGKHGVGLAPADPVLSSWGARLEDWLKTRGIIPR